MVVQGVYHDGDKTSLYPDIGYSFCNCKCIFYTKPENVWEPLKLLPDGDGTIIYPDPFFCEWGNNPYSWVHWNPRHYEVLWDMLSLVESLPDMGYSVLSYKRDFDEQSRTPQCFHIKVRKNA